MGCPAVQLYSHIVERLVVYCYSWFMVVHLGVQLWTIRLIGILEDASETDCHGVPCGTVLFGKISLLRAFLAPLAGIIFHKVERDVNLKSP